MRSKESDENKRSSSTCPHVAYFSNDVCRDPLHHRRSQSRMRIPDDITRSYRAREDKRAQNIATTVVWQNKRSGGTSRRNGRVVCSDDSYMSFDDRTRSTATSSLSSDSESSEGHPNRNAAAYTRSYVGRQSAGQRRSHGDRSFARSYASLHRRSTATYTHSCIGSQSAGQRRSHGDRSFARSSASLHQRGSRTSETRSSSGKNIDLWQPGSRSHASTAHLLHNSSFNIADDYHEDWDVSEREDIKNKKGTAAIKLSQEAAAFFSQGRTAAKSPLEILRSDASSSCSTVSSLTLPKRKGRGGSIATALTRRRSLPGLSFRWNRR